MNKEYRNIDKETDVLSFPMFLKEEIEEKIINKQLEHEEVLGDIVISIERVIQQSEEYGHSFERELSYMVVHSFYHLMGYDHIQEEDKKINLLIVEDHALTLFGLKTILNTKKFINEISSRDRRK